MWFKKIFIPNLSPERPQILLVDNHKSHLSDELQQQAVLNGIILFALPPYLTGKLQPLDVSFFAMVKADFSRIINEARLSQEGIITRRENVPTILGVILNKPKYEVFAKKGFEKAGIHPFNPQPLVEEAAVILARCVF